MTSRFLPSMRVIGTVLCALGLGAAAGLLVASQTAVAKPAGTAIFPATSLMPGQTIVGHFEVPAQNQTFSPWLRVRDLRDGCLGSGPCDSSRPLSGLLQVVVTAPDGSTRETSIADLVKPELLPGGDIVPSSGARRYQATLALPASAGNSAEARNVSFDLQYGSQAHVLGETFHRGGGTRHPGVTNQGGALPFTGADIVVEVAAALSLLAIGIMLLLAGRRRLHPDRS
jgi:hypothetical protein